MPKKLQLSIPKPCHENWDNMTPVQQGKFCGSCQKQVVDFSNMSDRQVAEFFKKPSTGSVCGRFMTDQLERNMEIPRKRIPWLKYFFQFAIPAFLVSIRASAEKTQGQIRVKAVTTDTAKIPKNPVLMGKVSRPVCTRPLMGDTIITPVESIKGEISTIAIDQRNRTIVGKVTDEKGDILPGVSIQLLGTRTGTSADNNGQFRIIAKTGDVIRASGAGLGTTDQTVGLGNSISITMNRITIRGGEVVVTAGMVHVRRPSKKELKNVPLIKQTPAEPPGKIFKVFPNPIESGSSINIEIEKMEEGYYSVQLLDQSGQSVHQQEIWIDAEARHLSMDIPPLAAGSYFLSLASKRSGKRFTEKIIIR